MCTKKGELESQNCKDERNIKEDFCIREFFLLWEGSFKLLCF